MDAILVRGSPIRSGCSHAEEAPQFFLDDVLPEIANEESVTGRVVLHIL